MKHDPSSPQPRPAALEHRRHHLVVLGAASVVLALSTVAARGAVTVAEIQVFRAVNDLPQGLYVAVWPVMQYGTFLTIPVLAAVAVVFRRFRLAVAMLLSGVGVVAVLFGRLYVGAHLPLDVVGGAALGAVAGSIVSLAIPAQAGARRPQPAAAPKRSSKT